MSYYLPFCQTQIISLMHIYRWCEVLEKMHLLAYMDRETDGQGATYKSPQTFISGGKINVRFLRILDILWKSWCCENVFLVL